MKTLKVKSKGDNVNFPKNSSDMNSLYSTLINVMFLFTAHRNIRAREIIQKYKWALLLSSTHHSLASAERLLCCYFLVNI